MGLEDPSYSRPVPAYRLSPDVVSRELGDEIVLVHLGTNQIYRLNTTAARWWTLVQDGLDEQEVLVRLQQEFDVDAEEARRDIAATLDGLQAAKLVITG